MNLKKSITPLLSGIVLLVSATSTMAQDYPVKVSEKDRLRHETTGVVGGAVIGGIVGGPFGAVLTAAFGGWVSDKTLAKKQNVLLTDALEKTRSDLVALQAEYRALDARYQLASREAETTRQKTVSFDSGGTRTTAPAGNQTCCADAELELHFKTNSNRIESLYEGKLAEFVALAKSLPDPVIAITGHADRRGGSAANLALSQRRVQAVEHKLQALGLNDISYQTSAYGESKPLSNTDSLENNFFDRRVVVKIVSPGSGYLTGIDD